MIRECIDPISPALFTILSNILFRILIKAKAEGKLSGIKISQTNLRITHQMYADDHVIYGQATMMEATKIFWCLNIYCQWIGQTIN